MVKSQHPSHGDTASTPNKVTPTPQTRGHGCSGEQHFSKEMSSKPACATQQLPFPAANTESNPQHPPQNAPKHQITPATPTPKHTQTPNLS
ncbi:hypothetical protein DV515_00016622 [Chloebia gouldiae]|uniref:Uncharacterized protein n=1 Tax=Chloebia gouldiae TaxID=44316 RepID=A0A3L8RRU1_CHLGU|nr:hypothetical protein DV515_00016622 [Chloebia gouldiae]